MNLKNYIPVLLLFSSLMAKDIRISGANHGEYWVFVDEQLDSLNYKEHLQDKLKLMVDYADLNFKGTFFLWRPSLPNPEKLQYFDWTALYRKDPVNLLYGTYYATFGRGLVLNQFLDEDFNNDNSLYGLKFNLKYLNSQFTLLSGRPRNIFFEENIYKIKNDTTDQIRGANLETKLIPMTTVGGHYVRVNRAVDLTPRAFTELFGGNIGFKIGPLESYFEYAQHLGCHPVIGGRLRGEGKLFTISLALSGLGISFQYMDYDTIGFGGADYRYNEPPTPIKSGISVNRGIDERGYGITFSATPVDLINAEFDYNEFKTHNKDAGVTELIAKATYYLSDNLELISGFEKTRKDNIEMGIGKETTTKPYLEASYDFGPFFTEAGYEHNFTSVDTSDYYDQAFSFSIGRPELLVFSFRYERRNRVPEWLILKLGKETIWPLAELSLDLTNRHNLRVRVGGEKGGLVCSGGVCRFEEPFRGVKMILTSIF